MPSDHVQLLNLEMKFSLYICSFMFAIYIMSYKRKSGGKREQFKIVNLLQMENVA